VETEGQAGLGCLTHGTISGVVSSSYSRYDNGGESGGVGPLSQQLKEVKGVSNLFSVGNDGG
jgi:hypothetical protein